MKGLFMPKAVIHQVDGATYHLGQMIDSLRPHWYQHHTLKFFEAICNWTLSPDTLRYYQILANDQYQAKTLAKQTYAKEFHIHNCLVDVKL